MRNRAQSVSHFQNRHRPGRDTDPRLQRANASRDRQATRTSAIAEGLTLKQIEFALNWLANGYNATAAYKAAHPEVTSGTARIEGHRTLAKPNIRAWLLSQLESRWAQYEMSADEASARVAMDARADIRLLFDTKGRILPPHEWPDEIASSVRSVRQGKYGLDVRLNDSLAARRLILELTGKFRSAGHAFGDLAQILAEKWDKQ